MKRFAVAFVLLLVLTALMLAGYFSGVFRAPAPPEAAAITVTEEMRGDIRITELRLRDAATRRHWHSEGDNHRVDIRREGADLYHLDIALLDERIAPLERRMRSTVVLRPGRHRVGGFSYDDVGQQRVRRRIEVVIEE
ncbi:hypothetical protein [Alloalcanivorax venustensis]|jgi:hypothetical protein|uniref:LPS export ABC transporter periplasmic protein LptC n=1 Tax=Alloalcanivorax venustensis ISO4 TaxID=1177184 RepID=A0ABS0AHA0_9GAMM|nr:hypothetical protein [Alloalcanivorax venustensis]KXJ42647.1 MAG: hypothetical protein AXW13_01240 [Alcanivorax sp. Nap_24]MBF5053002.1 hypothetical protein [Alloalcanivorax venustensis ISO4]MED5602448.1 hypothetical protein [Pseudomonadota bacterium]|tara:strand:- start:9 stop:422 length:414 start_codon:yes stop_codon:yes gene_type:complete